MSEGLSGRAFTRRHSVSHIAVQKAIKRGDIIPAADGSITQAGAQNWLERRRWRQDATGEVCKPPQKALLGIAVAKLAMKRRRAEQLKAKLVDRKQVAGEIRAITTATQAEAEKLATSSEPLKR